MTDYLELLLEVWQEEENEGFIWPRKVHGRRGTAVETPLQNAAEQYRAEERSEVADMRRVPVAETGVKAFDPAQRLEMLERAVARGKAAQAGRERKPAAAAQVQDFGVRGAAGRAETMLPGVQRSLTGLLDAAFERDARRYDGPLGLF